MILQRQIRQQTAHTLQLRIARQINLQRSDRSLTVLHRIKIRAFITILHRARHLGVRQSLTSRSPSNTPMTILVFPTSTASSITGLPEGLPEDFRRF